MTEQEYINLVYEYLFYVDKKWNSNGPTAFFHGAKIHYKDFMKAKRGSL